MSERLSAAERRFIEWHRRNHEACRSDAHMPEETEMPADHTPSAIDGGEALIAWLRNHAARAYNEVALACSAKDRVLARFKAGHFTAAADAIEAHATRLARLDAEIAEAERRAAQACTTTAHDALMKEASILRRAREIMTGGDT